MKREKNTGFIIIRAIELITLLLAVWIIFAAFKNTAENSGEEGRRQLETSLRRSVMACYATEGVYPPDLNYLKDHYGLLIDEKKYSMHYEAFASNLMPEITVLEIEE